MKKVYCKKKFVKSIIAGTQRLEGSVDPDEAAHYELPRMDLHC